MVSTGLASPRSSAPLAVEQLKEEGAALAGGCRETHEQIAHHSRLIAGALVPERQDTSIGRLHRRGVRAIRFSQQGGDDDKSSMTTLTSMTVMTFSSPVRTTTSTTSITATPWKEAELEALG